MTPATLADELVLLAYDNDTGRSAVPRIALDLGIAAAILVDLVIGGRLSVAGDAVTAVNEAPTGEPVADEMLARIVADTPHSAASWVQRLRHRARDLVLASLVQRGIVRDQQEMALEHIHLHRYPTVDPSCETEIRARLAEALTGRSVPDERTSALAALVAAVRMEPTLGLTGDAVMEAHKRLEEIAENAGFSADTVLENSTVRPSVAFVIGELYRAVNAALGPSIKRPTAGGTTDVQSTGSVGA